NCYPLQLARQSHSISRTQNSSQHCGSRAAPQDNPRAAQNSRTIPSALQSRSAPASLAISFQDVAPLCRLQTVRLRLAWPPSSRSTLSDCRSEKTCHRQPRLPLPRLLDLAPPPACPSKKEPIPSPSIILKWLSWGTPSPAARIRSA